MNLKQIKWTESAIECLDHGQRHGAIQLSLFDPIKMGFKFMPDCKKCPVFSVLGDTCQMATLVEKIITTHGEPREVVINNVKIIGSAVNITHKEFHWAIFALIRSNPGITYTEISKQHKTLHDKLYSALKMGVKKGCLIKETRVLNAGSKKINHYFFQCTQPHCLNKT